MLALKKRSKGRGRGRGTKRRNTKESSEAGAFTLQRTVVRKSKAELRIINEFAKNEVHLDADVYQLWIDGTPDVPRAYLKMKLAVTPQEGLWTGIRFVFQLEFPHEDPYDYPNMEPKVTLIGDYKIYHTNINYDGKVCLGYRRQNPWKAAWGIKTVALSLISILTDPNPDNPQDGCKFIAEELSMNKSRYLKNVAASLRGETLMIEGRSCPFPSKSVMNSACKVPEGATILSGKGFR